MSAASGPANAESQHEQPEPVQPGRDELLAMAWADHELSGEELRSFELRMADDVRLAQLVAEYQRLAVMARNARAPEPMDAEWSRLRRSPLQSALRRGSLLLLASGLLALSAVALWRLFASELSMGLKLCSTAALAGTVLYFLAILRARLSTRAYDPYRSVRR